MRDERTRPRNPRDRFALIVEPRGGWDEWSDKYEAVMGLRLPDGTEFRRGELYVDSHGFEDSDGNPVFVDLPQRPANRFWVEQHEPHYKQWDIETLKELQEAVESGELSVVE